MDTIQFSGTRRRLAGLAMAAALLGAAAAPAAAALSSGTIYAGAVNTPGGSVWMGTHLWATDHVNGLCRLDPADPANPALKLPAGSMAPNTATCVLPGGGQPSYDPATNFVYVPDNSTKGTSVLRFKFDPTSETVTADGALGGTAIVAGTKPTGSALDTADGSLYVSSGAANEGAVVRITNPSGTQVDAAGKPVPTVASVIGATSDGRGALGVTLANHRDGTPGRSLYLAEGGAISEIKDPAACTGACKADVKTGMLDPTVINGKAVVWEGLDVLADPANPDVVYLAKWAPHALGNNVTIDRHTLSTGAQIEYATSYTAPDGKLQPFTLVKDLAANPAGGLFVAHDPTNGGTNGALISRLP